MKVIIFGSRFIKKLEYIGEAVAEAMLIPGFEEKIHEIVSSGAPGVDTLATDFASNNSIDLTIMYANWSGRGKSAGFHRNGRMVTYADAGIAVWDGVSNGTRDTIDKLKKAGKPVHIKIVTDHK